MTSEFLMTGSDRRRIAEIMRAETGVVLAEEKAALIYSRLAKRLRALGLRSFAEYCELISQPVGAAEREAMVAALTTNVTRFFREPHHFDHLRTKLLPPLLGCLRRGDKLRLWSAGCSSGQEAYSIALTVLSLLPKAPGYDIRILGTDIDRNMIAAAQAAIYSDAEMASVPPPLRRWFNAAPDHRGSFVAGPELRDLVRFNCMNLIGEWPMRGRFQAIFCRNVVIYFDDITKTRIWDRMTRVLMPEGALYIGHSEVVGGRAQDFLRSEGVTTYRLATHPAAAVVAEQGMRA